MKASVLGLLFLRFVLPPPSRSDGTEPPPLARERAMIYVANRREIEVAESGELRA